MHAELAVAEDNMGNGQAARDRLSRAHAILKQYFGDDHPSVAYTLDAIARLEMRRGSLSKAESWFQNALENLQKRLPAQHASLAGPKAGMAWIRAEFHDYIEAERRQREVIKSLEAAFGLEHPLTAAAQRQLAAILVADGALSPAEEAATRSLAICLRKLDHNHLDVVAGILCLASIRGKQGRHIEAKDLFHRAAGAIAYAITDSHPMRAEALLGEATALRHLGEDARAFDLAVEVMGILAARPEPELRWQAPALIAELLASQPAAAILFGKIAVNLIWQTSFCRADMDQRQRRRYLTDRTGVLRALWCRLICARRISEAEKVQWLLKDEEFKTAHAVSDRRDAGGMRLSLTEAEWFGEIDALLQEVGTLSREREEVGGGIPALPEQQEKLKSLSSRIDHLLKDIVKSHKGHQPTRPAQPGRGDRFQRIPALGGFKRR